MASIRLLKGKWQVQVRRKGHPPVSKTFTKKKDAGIWARKMESLADFNDPTFTHATGDCASLNDLLDRYVREVVVQKRGAEIERVIIRAFQPKEDLIIGLIVLEAGRIVGLDEV